VVENIWPLDAVAGMGGQLIFAAVIGCAHVIFDVASERFQSVRLWGAVAGTGGKMIFAAAAIGCVHVIFDAASEHFRHMVNQMVNMKPQVVLAMTRTLSCQRIWR
jgi:hypothetical protein